LFGPIEPAVANTYRRFFINLSALVGVCRDASPDAPSILEIGAGDGSLTTLLARAYPRSRILGIDVVPSVGRLYRGDTSLVEFRRQRAEELCASGSRFSLVVVCDVLHHVRPDEWRSFLSTASRLVVMGGHLVVKEWVRSRSLRYWLGYMSDRFISGERVRYLGAGQFLALSAEAMPLLTLVRSTAIEPGVSNLACVFRRGQDRDPRKPVQERILDLSS